MRSAYAKCSCAYLCCSSWPLRQPLPARRLGRAAFAGMDFLFGIKGRDFVMVCSDTCASQQIITIKHDEDKLVPIDSHKLIGISGAR